MGTVDGRAMDLGNNLAVDSELGRLSKIELMSGSGSTDHTIYRPRLISMAVYGCSGVPVTV